jgi:hypothetical protein
MLTFNQKKADRSRIRNLGQRVPQCQQTPQPKRKPKALKGPSVHQSRTKGRRTKDKENTFVARRRDCSLTSQKPPAIIECDRPFTNEGPCTLIASAASKAAALAASEQLELVLYLRRPPHRRPPIRRCLSRSSSLSSINLQREARSPQHVFVHFSTDLYPLFSYKSVEVSSS